MSKRFLILYLLLIVGKALLSQNQPIVGWYSPVYMKAQQPEPQGYTKPITIPVKMAGNLIMIEATIDDETGYFIFDTGAPYLVLNSTYFRDYPHVQEYAAIGVNNLEVEIFRTRVDELKIRNLVYENLDADVANLGHLENSRGIKILGLLGTNLFTDFVLGINIAQQFITLTLPADVKTDATVKYNVIPFTLKNNTISVSATMNGVPLNFVLDTGAEINVLDNSLPDKAYESFIIQKRNTLNGSVGETIDVFAGITLRAEVGGFPFLNMKTIMTNLNDIGRVYGIQVDGILGYEFLIKSPVIIDFSKKEVRLAIREFYD